MFMGNSGLRTRQPNRQGGIILLLIVLSMLAIGGVIFLGALSQTSGQRALVQQVSGAQTLMAAKQALIGYAVSRILPITNGRLGRLPQPDTLTDGNYDGSSDNTSCLDGNAVNGMPALLSAATQVTNLRCVGRLPWSDLGLSIDGASDRDVLGIVPWYAVSPNFADPTAGAGECVTILNAVTMAGSPASFSCPTSTGPAWPWMKVCDSTGRILSSRVAFVLILPGESISTTGRTQQRTITATGSNANGYGNPSDFLDALPTPASWSSLAPSERCNSFDNANLSGEFIIADRSSVFNDQVIYVTVDELMIEIEKRVASEVRAALTTFRSNYGGYPWMAPIGNPTLPTSAMLAAAGTNSGFIPFHVDTTTGAKFMTELAWNIVSDVNNDTRIPLGNLTTIPTQFACGGGPNATCLCRPRTIAIAQIPRTITDAQFTAIKTGVITSVTSPLLTCARDSSAQLATRNTRLSCDVYSYTLPPTSVSYTIQRRSGNCTTGTYAGQPSIGTFAGTQTRTVTLTLTVIGAGTAAASTGTSTTHTARSFTNPSVATNQFIDVTDRWVPDTLGSVPFDQFSTTFPTGMQTGNAFTQATGSVTLSNIRVYPDLPTWYFSQKWYESMFAALSPDVSPTTNAANCSVNCLTAGTKTNVNALVTSTGPALATTVPAQNRTGVTPGNVDFLEPPNSTGPTTRIYADATQKRTATYADSIATIPQ